MFAISASLFRVYICHSYYSYIHNYILINISYLACLSKCISILDINMVLNSINKLTNVNICSYLGMVFEFRQESQQAIKEAELGRYNMSCLTSRFIRT